MKEQLKSAVLTTLPIVGNLRITTLDFKKISSIDVVDERPTHNPDPFFKECFEKFELFLKGNSHEIQLDFDLSGLTKFQKEVLKVMKSIPYGKVITYKDIAEKMKTRAYQAVGNACGKNPLLLIYPCHRVVGTKNLGGFAHGLLMKKKLLNLEARSL